METMHPLTREALETFGDEAVTFEGPKHGQSLLVIGGTHGNEISGILVVQKLREYLERTELQLTSGALTLMLGNTRAIAENKRMLSGGHDLNRIFTPEVLAGKENRGWEGRRARNMAEVIAKHAITIDLHSTNLPSDPFVCTSIDPQSKSVYRWLPARAVVEDRQRIITAGGGAVDEYAYDTGNIGVCYESGLVRDTSSIEFLCRSIVNIMIDQGMVEGTLSDLPHLHHAYSLTTAVPYDHREGGVFLFASNKGRGFARITRGEVIGTQNGKPIHSNVDGVVLFPKTPELQERSGVVCYLAQHKIEYMR